MGELSATRAPRSVIDSNGLQGVIVEGASVPPGHSQHLLVRFENGQELFVPIEILSRHQDGHYHLNLSVEALLAEQAQGERVTGAAADDLTRAVPGESSLVVPVIDETLNIHKRQRETGVVEIRKTIHERTETVDPPLYVEEVEVERVAINRFVDAPVAVRHEEDTTIIPLLEEVLVVEKRLLLREEVHVKKAKREVHNPQSVTLREERVELVRKPDGKQGDQPENTQS